MFSEILHPPCCFAGYTVASAQAFCLEAVFVDFRSGHFGNFGSFGNFGNFGNPYRIRMPSWEILEFLEILESLRYKGGHFGNFANRYEVTVPFLDGTHKHILPKYCLILLF